MSTRRRRGLVVSSALAAIGILAVATTVLSAEDGPETLPGRKQTVLITGANRGLGLEFARQFAAAGYDVIGTARRPEGAKDLRALGVRVEQLDVTDAESVAKLAAAIGDRPVDILINNAGIGDRVLRLADVDIDMVDRIYQVNCIGPMRVTKVLLPSLRSGDRKLVINITSGLGSLQNNTRGGYYGYRESKAALNMFTRSLSAELGKEGFICIVMAPGWVRTGMGGPHARLSPQESIGGMISVIEKLGPGDGGRFFNYDGRGLDW